MDGDILKRLSAARILWVSTVRPDGRPHLTPVWYVVSGDDLVICISDKSVKARNLGVNAHVSCALEDGNSPIIGEGEAAPMPEPWPAEIHEAFQARYEWDIASDAAYNLLMRITFQKWLKWSG